MVKSFTIRTSTAGLRAKGIIILADAKDPVSRFAEVQADDVVILPAFGVTVGEMEHLRAKHCVLVDTTCGSVLNVWKKVQRCAATDSLWSFTESTITKKPERQHHRPSCITGSISACGTLPEAEIVCRFPRGER